MVSEVVSGPTTSSMAEGRTARWSQKCSPTEIGEIHNRALDADVVRAAIQDRNLTFKFIQDVPGRRRTHRPNRLAEGAAMPPLK